MTRILPRFLATLAAVAAVGCAETPSQPEALDATALVASASAWTPAEVALALDVDAPTRQKIEAGLERIHGSLLELHERHSVARTLEGEAQAAYLADLDADMRAMHEEHMGLLESLDPAVSRELMARIHEHMGGGDHPEGLHDRMMGVHGGT